MQKPKIHFVSGLGADERAFVRLNLAPFEPVYIRWIQPFPEESLNSYCHRLSEQISDRNHLRLAGMSFGGLVVQEMAGFLPVEKLCIISSLKNPDEMDWRYNLVRKSGIHRKVPVSLIKKMNDLTANHYFGIQNKEEEDLLRSIIADSDETFVDWAVQKIMEWKGPPPGLQLLHLHGTDDRIFPAAQIKDATWVQGGSHFMVFSMADEVSRLLLEFFNEEMK